MVQSWRLLTVLLNRKWDIDTFLCMSCFDIWPLQIVAFLLMGAQNDIR